LYKTNKNLVITILNSTSFFYPLWNDINKVLFNENIGTEIWSFSIKVKWKDSLDYSLIERSFQHVILVSNIKGFKN
jgi:hypothetical protein